MGAESGTKRSCRSLKHICSNSIQLLLNIVLGKLYDDDHHVTDLLQSVSAGLAYRRLQSGVDTDLETSLLGADQVSGSYSGGAVGGYQDIGGYNEAVAETGQYRQQQSPFTQISDSQEYQPLKYHN